MSKKIALIGLDGSGKSANIDQMKKDPDYLQYNFVWVRWKPTLLKPVYMLMKKGISKRINTVDKRGLVDGKSGEMQAELNADYTIKSGLKKRIFRIAIVKKIWMILAIMDYFFQFYIKVFPLVFLGKNIVFDRFYLDLFVDQGINFGYSPERIDQMIKKYEFLFPKIDRYIYIRVSPEICYRRKNDIPNMEYLNKRYRIYEYISKKDNWTIVNGELPFEQVNAQIKEVML